MSSSHIAKKKTVEFEISINIFLRQSKACDVIKNGKHKFSSELRYFQSFYIGATCGVDLIERGKVQSVQAAEVVETCGVWSKKKILK